MAVSFNDAISAYRNAASGASATVADKTGAGDVEANPAESFASMVNEAAHDVRDTMMNSETMTQKAIVGDAELQDVVTAVSAAEISLKTVVAVRDKAVEAYQSILQMQI